MLEENLKVTAYYLYVNWGYNYLLTSFLCMVMIYTDSVLQPWNNCSQINKGIIW